MSPVVGADVVAVEFTTCTLIVPAVFTFAPMIGNPPFVDVAVPVVLGDIINTVSPTFAFGAEQLNVSVARLAIEDVPVSEQVPKLIFVKRVLSEPITIPL